VREVVRQLEELNEVLNLDFGEDDRFAPLLGQCFDFEDREYVYTLCPFKTVSGCLISVFKYFIAFMTILILGVITIF
jgi:hypothetical protein